MRNGLPTWVIGDEVRGKNIRSQILSPKTQGELVVGLDELHVSLIGYLDGGKD